MSRDDMEADQDFDQSDLMEMKYADSRQPAFKRTRQDGSQGPSKRRKTNMPPRRANYRSRAARAPRKYARSVRRYGKKGSAYRSYRKKGRTSGFNSQQVGYGRRTQFAKSKRRPTKSKFFNMDVGGLMKASGTGRALWKHMSIGLDNADLTAIFAAAGGLDRKLYVHKLKSKYSCMNNTNYPQYLEYYIVQPRQGTPASCDPDTIMENGWNVIGATPVAANETQVAVDIFSNPVYTKAFKIVKSWKETLAPAASSTFDWTVAGKWFSREMGEMLNTAGSFPLSGANKELATYLLCKVVGGVIIGTQGGAQAGNMVHGIADCVCMVNKFTEYQTYDPQGVGIWTVGGSETIFTEAQQEASFSHFGKDDIKLAIVD